MKTIIKKPISIVVYEYDNLFRVESFYYSVKEEKTIRLHKAFECETEKEMIDYTGTLKQKYEVKDFYRNLKQDEEIDYTPHHQFKVFKWTPKELTDVMNNFFKRTYGHEVNSYVEYDVYNGNFRVIFGVSEDFGEYDDFNDLVMDDFTYADEKKEYFSYYNVDWNEIFPRILREIVGAKLVMINPVESDIYGYREMTWSDNSKPAYFFFE